MDAWQPYALRQRDLAVALDGLKLGAALDAFARLRQRPADRTYRTGRLGIHDETLVPLADLAAMQPAARDPAGFFSHHFEAFDIVRPGAAPALFTGFYEPEIEASRQRTDAFDVPVLARPPDLVECGTDDVVIGMPDARFGRAGEGGRLLPYHDRAEINRGALSGRGLELFFLRDAVEAFFVHIQGAALLRLTDGTSARITFDGKSGHPFTGIGRLLVDEGKIAAAAVSMQAIKDWLRANPDAAHEMMERNRSYIFFRETPFVADHPGPVAAAKVPLTPGASIAVDRLVHTFGVPFLVESPAVNSEPFHALMIAQDTGSAIVGPARADLYFGTGDAAGSAAGSVVAHGTMTVLVPKSALPAVRAANIMLDTP